ncbi:MAG: histidine kinase, partial [Bacteroidota bacterium]
MRLITRWLCGWAMIFCLPLSAQIPPEIDSLERILEDPAVLDTMTILNHYRVSNYYFHTDLERLPYHAQKMVERSEILDYPLGVGLGHIRFGEYYRLTQQNDSSLWHYKQSIPYVLEAGIERPISLVYASLGNLMTTYDVDSAAYYFQKSLDALKDTTDNFTMRFSAYSDWGRLEMYRGRFPEALRLLQMADSVNRKSLRPANLGAHYVTLSTCYSSLGEYEKAIEACFLGIAECERTGNQKDIYDHYINLAKLKYRMGEREEALTFAAKALPLIEEREDRRALGELLIDLGEYAKAVGNWDLALGYYRQAEQVNREINNPKFVGHAVTGLANVALVSGQLTLAYAMASEVRTTAAEFGDLQLLAEGHQLTGRVLGYQRRFEEAYRWLAVAQGLVDSLDSPEQQLVQYTAYVTVDSLAGRLGDALAHLRAYNQLKDSLFTLEKNKQVVELETKYETEKTERELEQVTQQASIQTLELQRSQLRLVLLGVGLVAVLLAGGLVILRNRQARLALTYKAQDVEQNLLRTQMNPHFIFNAMTAIQDVIRQGDPKKASRYLSKFSKLTRQVLDNSRTEFVLLEQEVTMLENYLSLQNLRRAHPFQIEVKVAEDVDPEEVKIPPMFAQPFVENAIEHGLADVEEEGRIEVCFGMQGDKLQLTVTDNGQGLAGAHTETQTPGHVSHATQITRERIALY